MFLCNPKLGIKRQCPFLFILDRCDKIYKNLHDSEAKKSVFEKLLDKSYVKTSKYYENSTNKGTRFFYPFKEGVFELSNHIFSVDWNKINN